MVAHLNVGLQFVNVGVGDVRDIHIHELNALNKLEYCISHASR